MQRSTSTELAFLCYRPKAKKALQKLAKEYPRSPLPHRYLVGTVVFPLIRYLIAVHMPMFSSFCRPASCTTRLPH
jgi:hypothetical protein